MAEAGAERPSPTARAKALARRAAGPFLEHVLLAGWATWVGRTVLTRDPWLWPRGSSVDLSLHGSFLAAWRWARECGPCALWNGASNGGAPLLGEQLGGVLHPLAAAATLLFGPAYGVKVLIVLTLVLAGLAQWWIARVMGLGPIARLWAGALAVVAGHLSAPQSAGWTILNLSTVAVTLVLAPALRLGLTGRRPAAVALGLSTALAVFAGHGYMQMGLVLGLMPPLLLFCFDAEWRISRVWREYALAAGVAVLASAIYWLPLFHFSPNVAKPENPGYSGVQPLEYQPLNLVIRDGAFLSKEVLGQKAILGYHAYYVGWIPVLLAIAAVRLVPRSSRRLLAYFGCALTLVYLTSSAILPGFLARFVKHLQGMRHPTVIAALAVPLVIALAAWGLDELTKRSWPRLGLTFASGRALRLSTAWLLLPVPLFFAVKTAYMFSRGFWEVEPVPRYYLEPAASLSGGDAQWIRPANGNALWFGAGVQIDSRLKWVIPPANRSWAWAGRPLPPARLTIVPKGNGADPAHVFRSLAQSDVLVDPSVSYASVETAAGVVPCRAVASAGDLDIVCTLEREGILTVTENRLGGWRVTVDGARRPLLDGPWLRVAAPAGTHTFRFRYRPWDVLIGAVLSLGGLALAAALLLRGRRVARPPERAAPASPPAEATIS